MPESICLRAFEYVALFRRLMLLMTNGKGYAILDLYNPESVRPYVVAKGNEYEINGYTVSIEIGRLPFSLTVSTRGHLYDGQDR